MATDIQTIKQWEQYRLNLIRETTVSIETEQDKLKRKENLAQNPEAFFAYYFPNYSYAEPAPFHKKATKRILEHADWYEVRAWSRELAKSARTMFEVIYLALTGKVRNILMISATIDSAEKLLQPYKINLESNPRIINDYGAQHGLFQWSDNDFKTRNGVSFLAVGAGQSPRGTRNEEVRPDVILFDDIDTDEEVRNPDRIQKKWEWIEQAVIPTVSVSKGARIIFCGNIIGKDTCITRAMNYADYSEIINIRDKKGKSVWAKNTEAHIDRQLSKMSSISAQKEYFNNPISEGVVFKHLRFDKVPNLNQFRQLVCYGDPSPSNSENKKASMKAVWLCGKKDGDLYIIAGFLDQATNDTFVQWFYATNELVADAAQVYYFIENNTLQSPFYEQVIIPLFDRYEKEKYKIPIKPDTRKKPDKFARIEGNLEPLNSQGRIIFNVKEKSNPHMIRLKEQFEALTPQLSFHADGPDCIEGANWILDKKAGKQNKIVGSSKKVSKNRY